jgi:hypothetical protein
VSETILQTVSRNAACNAVVDQLDGAAGKLQICDGAAVLIEFVLSASAEFGNASTGVATSASAPFSGAATGAGDADNFKVRKNDNTLLWGGSAGVAGSGAGGADPALVLDNPSIEIGQTVNVASWTYTQPA